MIVSNRTLRIAAIFLAAILCAPVEASAVDDVEQQYTVAAAHFQRGRWKEAAEEFGRIVMDAPGHALATHASFYRAEALLRDGRSSDAAEEFEKFLSRDAAPALREPALFRAGEACYLADRRDDARRWLERLLAECPGTTTAAKAWFYLGDMAASSGDAVGAATAFGVLTAAYPDDPLFHKAALAQAQAALNLEDFATAAAVARALVDDADFAADAGLLAEATLICGEAQARLGDDVASAAAFRRFLALKPDDARAFNALLALGRSETKRGRKREALASYEQALKQFAKHERRYVALYEAAWLFFEEKRPAEAEAKLAELCRECPTCPLHADASYRLAERALHRGDHDAAHRRAAEAVSSAGPELLPHALLLEGQAAVERHAWPEAERAFERIVAEFSEHELTPIAEFWRAETAYRRGDYETAVERFATLTKTKRAATADAEPTAWLRLAQSHAQLRQWPETLAVAREAKVLFPRFEQAYEFDYLRGRAHAARAEMLEARRAYGEVPADARARGTETAALAQFMIAETYFHQRQFEAAASEYLRVDALHAYGELQAAALLQAGKCREQLGDPTAALALYDQLLKEHATSPYAAEAAGRRTEAARNVGAVRRK